MPSSSGDNGCRRLLTGYFWMRGVHKSHGVLARVGKRLLLRKLDEWIRHRMRAIQLRQWKRGPTIYRELRALGASAEVAQRVASNSHRWWRNSRFELNRVLNIAWFDRLGLVRLS